MSLELVLLKLLLIFMVENNMECLKILNSSSLLRFLIAKNLIEPGKDDFFLTPLGIA